MSRSLTQRVFRAGFWVILGFLFSRLLSFVRLAVLARVLAPSDFGLFGLVTVIVGGLTALTDIGIASAVVRKSEPDEEYLSTAWMFECVRGILLSVTCWAVAPWIAEFFQQPRLIELIRLASLVPLFQGMRSMSIPLMSKKLSYFPILLVELSHEVLQTLVSIALAWLMGWKSEALVCGLLAGHLVSLAVSFFIHPFRPRHPPVWKVVQELWAYGSHLLGAGILIYAMTNLDDIVIGWLLGPSALGQYMVVFTLAGYLTSKLVGLSNQVIFPAYAQIQKDAGRLLGGLQRHVRLVALILTPPVVLGVLFSQHVIRLLVGEKWVSSAGTFAILLVMGWIRGCATAFGPVLLAKGKTRTIHKMKWAEFLTFALLIVPAVHLLGIMGAACTLLLVYAISLWLHLRSVKHDLNTSYKRLTLDLLRGALPSAVAGGVAYAILNLHRQGESDVWWAFSAFLIVLFGMIWSQERLFLKMIWREATSG